MVGAGAESVEVWRWTGEGVGDDWRVVMTGRLNVERFAIGLAVGPGPLRFPGWTSQEVNSAEPQSKLELTTTAVGPG